MSYRCCNDTCQTTSLAIHEYDKALWELYMYILNHEETRVLRESHLSVVEIRYVFPCCFALFLRHPSNCSMDSRANNWVDGMDMYVAVVFTDAQPELWQQWEQVVVRPGFGVCRVFASEWLHCWGVLRSQGLLESMVSIAAFCPCQPWKFVCCWKRTASFVLLNVQEAAIPVWVCDWSTTIADSYPWMIPMSLMCESFWDIFLWVNIQ